MVAIKAHEAERTLARLDRAWRLILIYGPDTGLVSERASALARASVDDPQDAFQLVRMDGDGVAVAGHGERRTRLLAGGSQRVGALEIAGLDDDEGILRGGRQ